MSTHFRLEMGETTERFFDDTYLLGILTTQKNYQFCWQLNYTLGYNFFLNTDIHIEVARRGRKYKFLVYEHRVIASQCVYYLYENECEGEYLLPEFKHFDFLWLMKGDYFDMAQIQPIVDEIRTLSSVQLVTELTHEKFKNKSYLIF
ncbi:MAG: IPExxxVDY family protein [Chitinophagaceae bacterium]